MSVKTWVLLAVTTYKSAMLSAKAKNSTIDYSTLKNDRSWTLIYNPETADGIFIKKLNAMTYWTDGYFEAFPQAGRSRTLQQNIIAINTDGWPIIEGI
jgi:hypothetical protein